MNCLDMKIATLASVSPYGGYDGHYAVKINGRVRGASLSLTREEVVDLMPLLEEVYQLGRLHGSDEASHA